MSALRQIQKILLSEPSLLRVSFFKILVKERVNETHRTGPGYCESNNESAKRNRPLPSCF